MKESFSFVNFDRLQYKHMGVKRHSNLGSIARGLTLTGLEKTNFYGEIIKVGCHGPHGPLVMMPMKQFRPATKFFQLKQKTKFPKLKLTIDIIIVQKPYE